jgi:hypothetical protein
MAAIMIMSVKQFLSYAVISILVAVVAGSHSRRTLLANTTAVPGCFFQDGACYARPEVVLTLEATSDLARCGSSCVLFPG